MPRRFHAADELLPPATFLKRSLAIIYDGLISIAVLLVTTWIYTMITGWITGWDKLEQKAEAGQLSGDPGLTFVLFLVMYRIISGTAGRLYHGLSNTVPQCSGNDRVVLSNKRAFRNRQAFRERSRWPSP